MPAHRVCIGCGTPAAYGPWCIECIEDERDPHCCNVLVLNHSAIPFLRPEHVSATEFQGAIDRALGRGAHSPAHSVIDDQ